MTMKAPCAASSRTTAFPMPLLPPVTMATLPLRLIWIVLLSVWGGATKVLGARRSRCRQRRGGEDQVSDQGGPTGLMLGAKAHSGVAMEILVERDVVLPSGVGGQQV